MPVRPVSREQSWLLPPSLDELLPDDHPSRFVAAFVEGLDRAHWAEMGIDLGGDVMGAPSYHPRLLLCAWLYGFMRGIRSSRKIEEACRDQIPFLWLTGFQHPDHNTLWRFYKAHRMAMRSLLKYTVATAMEVGLVDLALQAVDGTKIAANAAGDQTHDRDGLQRLLDRTEAAIKELEAQNVTDDDPAPPRLPKELERAQELRERVRDAMERLSEPGSPKRVNLTDEDAQLMKGRQGIQPAYNGQAMVSPLPSESGNGMLITAADVDTNASDYGQLVPMVEQAEDVLGERVKITLADGGYHTAANLQAGAQRSQTFVMPERYHKGVQGPYFKDKFIYDPTTDSYTCPQGQKLTFRGIRNKNGKIPGPIRLYRASRTVCRTCPAYGVCTKDKHSGRALWIGPSDDLLRRHREWMPTEEAQRLYSRRKGLVEPVFGILKEQLGARRFLLRGLVNVKAEFTLLAVAFNLKTLCRMISTSNRPAPA